MTDNPTIKLLPCPFCGGAPKMDELGDADSYHVVCEECQMGFHANFKPQDAADRWNRRAIITASDAAIDVAIPRAVRWTESGHA
jgi:Lar family restriction alleviation protein